MNNTNQERHRRNVREGRSLMAQLRAIVPQRPLRWPEAERLTELQANRFRELLGIDTPELPDEAITELPRLLVTSDGDLPVSASAHWSNGRWIITLNALEHPLRQRFSAAHELHHIICHPLAAWMFPGEPGLPSAVKAERLADYFAGALLMPKRHVKRLWGEGHRAARELAAYFIVSPRAMQFRLDQLGLASHGGAASRTGGRDVTTTVTTGQRRSAVWELQREYAKPRGGSSRRCRPSRHLPPRQHAQAGTIGG